MLKIGLLSVGFPNFRYDIAQTYLDETIKYMHSSNIEMICCNKVLITEAEFDNEVDKLAKENINVLILQVGTYSYGNNILKLVERLKGTDLIIWGFREPIVDGYNTIPLNSLCGVNMYSSFLKKYSYPFSYIYGDLKEDAVKEKLNTLLDAIAVKAKLRTAKFCVIGGRVPGFYLSNVDELNFRKNIGSEIDYYSIAKLIEDCKKIEKNRVLEEVNRMKGEVKRVTTTEEALEKSARVYLAIKDYKQQNNIDGFAIKCWPDFQEVMQLAVCGVVSRLNSEGIMTACEGDISGLATMYIQHLFSKQSVFLTDLVNINEMGIAKAWHCGPAARTLADSCEDTAYIEHPTIKNGIGMSMQLELKKGRVTICKLSEGQPYKMFICTGQSIATDRKLGGNQADIMFDVDGETVLDTIIKHGIEHHYSIVYGDYSNKIKELCRLMNISLIEVR